MTFVHLVTKQREIAMKTLLPRETVRDIINKPNALEICSVQDERGRPRQQLAKRFSIY